MDSVSIQVKELYAQSDARGRQRIQEQLRDLQRDLSTDSEVFFGLALGSLQLSLTQVGFDLNLFSNLASSTKSVSIEDLVQQTNASPSMLSHLLRSLSALGLIQEDGNSAFTANRLTRILAKPHVVGAAPHVFDLHVPIAAAIPSYLRNNKYQDISGSKKLPFHQAMNTELSTFEWMKQDGAQMKALGHIMVLDAVDSWVVSYPVEQKVGDFTATSDSALLVDIGGGFGQHSIAFKQKFPQLPGRIVVQDIPSTLDHAPKVDGIEFQAYDFFTPQPIKGAKFYYLRHIMHDWSDEECVRILQNIVPAMGAESQVLIDEVVLPETNWPWQVALSDIAMMACLGGIERSEKDWEILLDQAGLKIVDVFVYDQPRYHGIVTAIPK